MIKNFKTLQRNYAKLLVNRGLHIPAGRIIKIVADIDQPDFINILVEECYKAGAKRVHVAWNYAPINRIIYERTDINELAKLYPHKQDEIKYDIMENVSFIYLESNSPNYLNGLDARKTSLPNKIRREYVNLCRGDNAYRAPYVIACLPSISWAKLLFPKLSDKMAEEKFWKLIFKICHVTSNDPYLEWDRHCKDIDDRATWLNSMHIKSLHYTSKKTGTDLIIGMNDKYQYAGTADWDIVTKEKYYSNIPTEECFVSPNKYLTEGVVYASKPLCENGQLIEGICLKFKKGRIVEATAKKNEEMLKALIDTDEGSHYLGEAALVPYTSLINKTNIIFLNTLYDENACCHFAFGDAYRYTYKGYETMTRQELEKAGLNHSSAHIDFMIGTDDLEIIATTIDNKKIPIFKDGVWAKKR